MKHCGWCGGLLLGSVFPKMCQQCSREAYDNPTPVASLIIPATSADGRVGALITRRAIAPFIGMWCLPGGHVEGIETAEVAAVRELQEEVGFEVDSRSVHLSHSFNTGNGRLLVFGEVDFSEIITAEQMAGFKPTTEVSEVAIFDPSYPDQYPICFSSHFDYLMRPRPYFG